MPNCTWMKYFVETYHGSAIKWDNKRDIAKTKWILDARINKDTAQRSVPSHHKILWREMHYLGFNSILFLILSSFTRSISENIKTRNSAACFDENGLNLFFCLFQFVTLDILLTLHQYKTFVYYLYKIQIKINFQVVYGNIHKVLVKIVVILMIF